MMKFKDWLEFKILETSGYILPPGVHLERSQGDGWKIVSPYGYIDYRHDGESDMNEIWWVETNQGGKGYGKNLVDLMQSVHPAGSIGWGVTTLDGKMLRDSWHRDHPNIRQVNGAFEGQFDPSGNNYGEDEEME